MDKYPVYEVSKEKGDEVVERLKEEGKLDPRRKILEDRGKLLIPVKEGENAYVEKAEFREEKKRPYEKIKKRIDLPKKKKRLLPDRWEMIGNVLLFKLPDELMKQKKEIAKIYADELDMKTVMLQGDIKGEKREPEVKKIYGDGTETVHLENGIRYKLDLSELMFSSGNIDERIRMGGVVDGGETVVDMFAGIGYFTLPMAVHGNVNTVHALEINPTAFDYLKENVRMNHVEGTVRPWNGDNRNYLKEDFADRVVMGYLHSTWKFLPKALSFLKSNGYIHYHTRCTDEDCFGGIKREIDENLDADFDISNFKKIKSYAPHVFHVVADIEVL